MAMNGFSQNGHDEDPFAPKGGMSALRTFDAFPKTKASYTQRSAGGGYATVVLAVLSALLVFSEFSHWWTGEEAQTFSVEKGVAHQMQINLDTVVHMRCEDLHINIQDASGDRILAGEKLTKDPTNWDTWTDPQRMKKLQVNRDKGVRQEQLEEDRHVSHALKEARSGGKKFPKSPRLSRNTPRDACRLFGSLEINRVQGDFHITARGHGYMGRWDEGHLDHQAFNFSHIINELSFGPLYPSLLNPLDATAASSDEHFARFQYYMSVVPTIFTKDRNPKLPPVHSDPKAQETLRKFYRGSTIITNQYAVTSQQNVVQENNGMPGGGVPGIFFKFDIEPVLLTITNTRGSLLALILRIVNVVSGIMVGGGWIYQLWGWAEENFMSKRRKRGGYEKGMLHGGKDDYDR